MYRLHYGLIVTGELFWSSLRNKKSIFNYNLQVLFYYVDFLTVMWLLKFKSSMFYSDGCCYKTSLFVSF